MGIRNRAQSWRRGAGHEEAKVVRLRLETGAANKMLNMPRLIPHNNRRLIRDLNLFSWWGRCAHAQPDMGTAKIINPGKSQRSSRIISPLQ